MKEEIQNKRDICLMLVINKLENIEKLWKNNIYQLDICRYNLRKKIEDD